MAIGENYGNPWAGENWGWTPENIDAIFSDPQAAGPYGPQTLAVLRQYGVNPQQALDVLWNNARQNNAYWSGGSPTGIMRGVWAGTGILPYVDNPQLQQAQQQEDRSIWASQQQSDDGFLGLGDLGNILALGGLVLGGAGLAGVGPLGEALGGVFGAEAGAGAALGAGEGALSLGEFAAGAGAAVPELGVAAAPGLAEAATAAGMGGEPFLTEEMLRQAGPTFFENLQQYTDPFRYANLARQAADYMGGDQTPSVSFSQGFAPTQVAGSYEDYVPTTYSDYGYDLPGAGGPGTSFPSSIPEPTDVAGAGEGLSFEDILKGVGKYGPLVATLGTALTAPGVISRAKQPYEAAAARAASAPGAAEALKTGQYLSTLGQQQLTAAQAGELPKGAAGYYDQLRRDAQARILQSAARGGRLDSSTTTQQINQAMTNIENARQQALAMREREAVNNITNAARLMGYSDAGLLRALEMELRGTGAAAQVARDIYGSTMANLPAALRALTGTTAPTTQVASTATATPAG